MGTQGPLADVDLGLGCRGDDPVEVVEGIVGQGMHDLGQYYYVETPRADAASSAVFEDGWSDR